MIVTKSLVVVALVVPISNLLPLKPRTSWQVEYADNGCVLSREYGNGAGEPVASFALRPQPLGQSSEMMLVTSDGRPSIDRRGRALVSLTPSGEQKSVTITRAKGAPGRVITRFDVDAAFLATLGKAQMISIVDGKATTQLPLGGADKALAALAPCQDDLMRKWGLDPALQDRITKPAAALGGGVAEWFSKIDYPFEAQDAGREGRTIIAWKIDEKGVPGECRLLASSGTRELDLMACAVIVRRGRFAPAIATSGKPVASYQTRAIRWAAF